MNITVRIETNARFVDPVNPDWVTQPEAEVVADGYIITVPVGEAIVVDPDPKKATKDRYKVVGPASISTPLDPSDTKHRGRIHSVEQDPVIAARTAAVVERKTADFEVLTGLGLSSQTANRLVNI